MKRDREKMEPTGQDDQRKRRFFNLLQQGTRALQQGQVGRALQVLKRAYQLDHDNVDVTLNLGGAYILSKKFTQAVALLEPLAEREPDNPMVWTNLGAAYLGNPILASDEDQRRAITAFEQAIKLNPATPHVAYNLGLIYRDRKEYKQALYWFQRAVQANPNDRDARNYIKKLRQEIGDEAEN